MKLFRRRDIVSANGISSNIRRWIPIIKRNIGTIMSSVALASAFGLAAPSVARAEEGTIDNTTPEMTYEMNNDELAEVNDGGFTEIVTADTTTDYGTVDSSSYAEQTVAEESAPVAEQTVAEESAPVAEQTEVQENATAAEQTVAEESSSTVEQTVVEESTTSSEEHGFSETVEYESSSSSVSGKPVAGSESEKKNEIKGNTEVQETQTTSRAAFTVVEKNGKLYVFTDAAQDETSQKLLTEKFNEWWNLNYGAKETPTNIYTISSLGKGAKTVYYYELVNGEQVKTNDFVDIVIDENNKVSIVDKEITKAEVLDDNLGVIEETNTKQETEQINKEETSKDETKTEVSSKTISYNETDYVVITGKDGSVTVVTKLPLSGQMGLKVRNDLIKSGKISNNSAINFMTLKQNGETVIGNNVLTIGKDGSLGIIGSDFRDIEAINDNDITDYLSGRIEKDKNGFIDSEKVKPDHEDPEEPTPEEPTPKDPTPEEPTSKKPTPEKPTSPTPDTPTTPETPKQNYNLPKTGDLANPLAAGVIGLAGAAALTAGVRRRRKDNMESEKDAIDDSILNNPEYKNEVERIDRAKHFKGGDDTKDRLKKELYDEFSMERDYDSSNKPKHLAR